MLSFKPPVSVSSFTFIKKLFNSASHSTIRVVLSAYLRLLIFLLAILIPACVSGSPQAKKLPEKKCSPTHQQIIGLKLDLPGSSVSKESAFSAGDPGLIPGWGRSPGEGNGNPLQCSCLEKSRDGGAWWAAISGIAHSRTRLKWLSGYPYGRKWRRTKEPLDESERGEWKSWLKGQHSEN